MAVPSAEVMALIKQGYTYEHATSYVSDAGIQARNIQAWWKFERSNRRVLQNVRQESRKAARAMVASNRRTTAIRSDAIDGSKGSDA